MSDGTCEEPFDVSDISEGQGGSADGIDLGLDEEPRSLLNYLWARRDVMGGGLRLVPGLPLDTGTAIHDCLILQCITSWPATHEGRENLVAELVGHINKSKKQPQQLDKLMDEVHSLDETLWKTRRELFPWLRHCRRSLTKMTP